MKITRMWDMSNKRTFCIPSIRAFIIPYLSSEIISVDPFANYSKLASITNDLDPKYGTDYNLEANEFLNIFDNNSVDLVLFDPPYTPRQVKECYTELNRTVTMSDTNAKFWRRFKKNIARVTKPDGVVLSFGWNSNGIGKSLGFKKIELAIVAHGGIKNDTLCLAEKKVSRQRGLFENIE